MIDVYWESEDGARGTAITAKAWIGPFTVQELAIPKNSRAARIETPEDVTWTNLAALSTLPWWRPQELLLLRPKSLDEVGCLKADSTVEAAVSRIDDLRTIWAALCGALPALPWSEIKLFAGPWQWPRALSIPGAILLAQALPLNSASSTLLYLVHELIHQWVGGVIAPPATRPEHSLMEATVDAYVWRVVTSVLPHTSVAFERLHEGYSRTAALRQHSEQVVRLYRGLNQEGWARSVDRLARSTGALRDGVRHVFTAIPEAR